MKRINGPLRCADNNLIYQPSNSIAMQLSSVTSGTDVRIAAPGVPVAILPVR